MLKQDAQCYCFFKESQVICKGNIMLSFEYFSVINISSYLCAQI